MLVTVLADGLDRTSCGHWRVVEVAIVECNLPSSTLLAPGGCIPNNVEAALVVHAKDLRHHEVVLSEPNLLTLVPPPITVVSKYVSR